LLCGTPPLTLEWTRLKWELPASGPGGQAARLGVTRGGGCELSSRGAVGGKPMEIETKPVLAIWVLCWSELTYWRL
jgi:hypothetical protein